MVLVIGGKGAGKREYVRSLGYADDEMSCDISSAKPVFYSLEEAVREHGAEGLFDVMKNKEVVICCEVGCGIVPLDKKEREYRDSVGGLCVRLAREAEAVVRVIAGIPQVIKGNISCR